MKEYHKTTLKQQQQELKQVKSALERTEKGLSNIIETIAATGFTSDKFMASTLAKVPKHRFTTFSTKYYAR